METKFPLLESITLRTVRLPSMRTEKLIGGVAASALALIGSLLATPSADASNFGVELNGKWRSSSNGQWAKTNDVYMNQVSVVETWTIATDCVSPIECSGTITSEGGWTAELRMAGGVWRGYRVVPNWIPCPDGTFADGIQDFFFYGMDPTVNERSLKIRNLMVGYNEVKDASGSCGINKPLVVSMPLRLDQLS